MFFTIPSFLNGSSMPFLKFPFSILSFRGGQHRIKTRQTPQHDQLITKGSTCMFCPFCTGCVDVVSVVTIVVARKRVTSSRNLASATEPPHNNLLQRQTLFCEKRQKLYGIGISVLKQLSYDGQQIPHAFRCTFFQWSQQIGPVNRK